MTKHRFAAEGMALSRLYYVWILPRLVACVVARYFNDNDVVDAVSGGNIVYGGARNDLLCGDDTVLGGAGGDQIQSNEARHTNYVRNTRPVGNIPVWKRQSRRIQRITHPLAAGLLAAIALAGCGEKYVPPNIQWKADPGERYNIRLELESPSIRNITKISGMANYSISNSNECMMKDRGAALGGMTHEPWKRIPLMVNKAGEKIFSTVAYKNPLMDEDYYGLGTCKWALRSVDIFLNEGHEKIVASLGVVNVSPGKYDVVCNEEMRFCVYFEVAHDMPVRIKKSHGVVIITRG